MVNSAFAIPFNVLPTTAEHLHGITPAVLEAFGEPCATAAVPGSWRLSQGVAHHLQKAGLAAGTVTIKLRYSDFSTLTRQMSLAVPTDNERTIYRAALVLLRRTWERGRPVRLLGVAGHQLSQPAGQLPLL